VKESLARDEICRVGRSLIERGYVHSTAGNISVRLDAEEGGGYLITPADSCLGFLEPSRLALLDREGNQLGGDRASKTFVLHRRIYEATVGTKFPAGCVIHTHSTHCVALTMRGAAHYLRGPDGEQELLPTLTSYFVMKVGHVPVIPYLRPGDPAAAEHVVSTIGRYRQRGLPVRAVMLERLGPNVWHDEPAAAMATLEELDETARLACLSKPDTPPLAEQDLQALRATFAASC
jgi:ribulose-5-phosphate 4-epimerase/fuculose-1-phosphate aldolase